MFDFIRSHQRLMQFFLLLFIVPSFALIGVSGYNSYVSGDHDLVKVGKSAITLHEFENARANQMRQMQQFGPEGFDVDLLDDPMVRSSVLESLIDRRVIADAAAAEKFNVSDAVLRNAISSMPEVQVEGQFSPERYSEVLESAGLTTREFEASQRAELSLNRILAPVADSTSIPEPVVKQIATILTEQRDIEVKTFNAKDFIDEVTVSSAEIEGFYNDNKESFKIPDHVSIQYILLDENAAMATVPELTADELKRYYDQNKSRFTNPARVKLSHIQVSVAAGATQSERDDALEKANQLLAKVKENPESFAEVAKEYSEDAGTAKNGGDLGWITQGTWPSSLDNAIFALGQGEISDVIDGQGGYHIFLASEVQPEEVQSYDEIKDTLQDEVRHQLGAERFADMATRLTSLVYDHPDSMDAVGQALSIDVKAVDGVARDRLLTYQEVGSNAAAESKDADILDDPRVYRAVYSTQVLTDGHNSGVIELAPDTMVAVRVVKHEEARVPELDKVKVVIEEELKNKKAHAMAVKEGQKHLKDLMDGSDAEGFGDRVVVSRMDPKGIQNNVVDAAMQVEPNEAPAYTGVEVANGFALIHVVRAIRDEPSYDTIAGLKSELQRAYADAEEQAVLEEMRVHANIEYLPEAEDVISNSDKDN